MTQRLHVVVSGRVQGVCFRMDAQDQAESLGLTGWVRNLGDGSVEILAEGEASDLHALLDWCRRGPPAAHVTAVNKQFSPARGEFASFDITR